LPDPSGKRAKGEKSISVAAATLSAFYVVEENPQLQALYSLRLERQDEGMLAKSNAVAHLIDVLWHKNKTVCTRNIVHFTHASGAEVIVTAIADIYGSFGVLQLCGTHDHALVSMKDSFYPFEAQLQAFVDYFQTGVRPFPFEETVELMKWSSPAFAAGTRADASSD
jgi:hypothetical protein